MFSPISNYSNLFVRISVARPVNSDDAFDDVTFPRLAVKVSLSDDSAVFHSNQASELVVDFARAENESMFQLLIRVMREVERLTAESEIELINLPAGAALSLIKNMAFSLYDSTDDNAEPIFQESKNYPITVTNLNKAPDTPIDQPAESDLIETVNEAADLPVQNLGEVFQVKQPALNSGESTKAVLIGIADFNGGDIVIKDDIHDYRSNKSIFGQDTPRYVRSLVFIKHANESDQAFIARINEHIAKVVYEADPGAGQLATFNLAVNAVWKIEGSDGGKKYLTENESYHFKSFRKDKGVLEDDPDYEEVSSGYNHMTFDGRNHNFVLHKDAHMKEVIKTHHEYSVLKTIAAATATTATFAPELLPAEAVGALFVLGGMAVSHFWSSDATHHDELRKRSLNPDDNIAFKYKENSGDVTPFGYMVSMTADAGEMPNINLLAISFKEANYKELIEIVSNARAGGSESPHHWSNFVQFKVMHHGENSEHYSLFIASKYEGGVDYNYYIAALREMAYSNAGDEFDSLTKEMAIVLIDENMDVVGNVFDVHVTPVNDAPVLDFDLGSASENSAGVLVAGNYETHLLQNAISLTDKDEAGYLSITMYSEGLVDFKIADGSPDEILKYHSKQKDHKFEIKIAEVGSGRFALDVEAGADQIYIRYQTVTDGHDFKTTYRAETKDGRDISFSTEQVIELLMNLKYVNSSYNYDWDLDPGPMINPTLGERKFSFTVKDNSGYDQNVAQNKDSNVAVATIDIINNADVLVVDDEITLIANYWDPTRPYYLLANDHGADLKIDHVILDFAEDYQPRVDIPAGGSQAMFVNEEFGLEMHLSADGVATFSLADDMPGFAGLAKGEEQHIHFSYVLVSGQVGQVELTVVGNNDAPVLMSHENMTFTTHSGGSTLIGSQFAGWLENAEAGINDADAYAKISKMKIDISDGAGHVTFAETADLSGLTLHYSLDGKTLEITGLKSTIEYNQLLHDLVYEAAVIVNGERQNVVIAGDQTVSVQVQDEHGYWSNVAEVHVHVDPVNIEANDDVVFAHEDMLSIIKDAVANDISDQASDNLKITEIMGLAVADYPNGVPLANGVLVKVINDTKLEFIFNNTFNYLSETGAADFSVKYTVQDESGQIETATTTVFVSGRNDAAVAVDSFINIDQTGTHVFRASDFGVIDADANDVHAVKIISFPDNHLLMVNEYGQEPRTARVGEVFTAEQINAGVLSVKYGGVVTHGSFQFAVMDGFSESAPSTMALNFPDDLSDDQVDIDDPYHLFFSVEMSEDETPTEVGVFDVSNFTNWSVISVQAPAYADLTFVKANDGLLHFTYVLDNDAAIVQALSAGESMQHVIRFSLQMDDQVVEGQLNAVITGVNDKPVVSIDESALAVDENNKVFFENKKLMMTDADDQYIDHVTFNLIGEGKLGVDIDALKAVCPWMDVTIISDSDIKLIGPASAADYRLATQYVFFDATDVAGGSQTIKVTVQDKADGSEHALVSEPVFFDVTVTAASQTEEELQTEYTAETVVFSVEEDVHDKRLAEAEIFEFDITDVSEWTINYDSSDYGAFVVSAAEGVVTLNFALNNDGERVQALNDDDQPLEEVLEYYITKNDGTEKISGRAIVEIQGHDEDFVPLNETITGNDWAEMLTGTDANNVMNALGGNDYVNGLAGDDELNGGEGGDVLNGGAGNDVLTGGAGMDVFYLSGLDELLNYSEQTIITDMVFGEDTVILGKMATYILENELDYQPGDIDAALIDLVAGSTVYSDDGNQSFNVDVSADADGDSQLRYMLNNEAAHTVKFVGHTFDQDQFTDLVNVNNSSFVFG